MPIVCENKAVKYFKHQKMENNTHKKIRSVIIILEVCLFFVLLEKAEDYLNIIIAARFMNLVTLK